MAIGVVVAVFAAAALIFGRDTTKDRKSGQEAAAGGEIFLEPLASTGEDPFTPSVSEPPPATQAKEATAPPPAPAAGSNVVTQSGGSPGLYGGTRNSKSCNPEQLITFLETHPDHARAWARVQGIPVTEIRNFVNSLTSVLLRSDTRVTNHGFANGVATAKQSVLQAGTAVMVDQFGMPRVRCSCGNPLLAPAAVRTAPRYTGPKWPEFRPAATVVIVQNTTVINNYYLVNVVDGQPFSRPPATDGSRDVDAPPNINVPNTAPTTTTTRPRLGDVSGTWQVTITAFRGGGLCSDAEVNTEPVLVTQQGSRLTMRDERGDGSETATGTIDPDGRFNILYSEGGFRQTIEGQFVSTNELRGTANLSGEGISCIYDFVGRR